MLTGFILLLFGLVCFSIGIVTAIMLDEKKVKKHKNEYTIDKEALK